MAGVFHGQRRFRHAFFLVLALAGAGLVDFPAKPDTFFTTTNTVWRYFKGNSEPSSPSSQWRLPDFNDAAWPVAPAPFYYTDTATEPPFSHGGPVIGTVLTDMINNYSCLFLRTTFVVSNASRAGRLTLHIAGDDGFVVWLNGVEAARTNVPAGAIPYNGTALASQAEPYPIHSLDLGDGGAWLRDSTNVLAIQGINAAAGSRDFGVMAGLSSEAVTSPPRLTLIDPSAGSMLTGLTSIRIVMNEPVVGVEATDLLINGLAASSVSSHLSSEYFFSFAEPTPGPITVSWAGSHEIRDESGNLFAGEGWVYELDPHAMPSASISEFMAENAGTLLDEDGQSPDWIEIHNPGPAVLSLNNWSLTDDATDLTKWRFPATNLAANSYLLVFASGKNRRVAGATLHTNFKLNQATGYVALVRADGVIASEFGPSYPTQRRDVSFGLSAGGSPVYFPAATPGAPNGPGVTGLVADTTFSLHRGFFFGPTNVTLRSATPGATLVYTLNGTEPSPANGLQINALDASTPPSVNIAISNTTLLRVMAFKPGYLSSDVDTHSYIFPEHVTRQTRPGWLPSTWPGGFPADFAVDARVVSSALPSYSFTNALLSLPSLSVSMPSNDLFAASTGIYANSGSSGPAWERRAALELIYPDGRPGFHVNCGLRIHGYSSADKTMTPKHSFSVMFRREFGASRLNFRLFTNSTVESFNHLVLRGCSTDSWSVFDDPFSGDPFPRWSQAEASYLRDQWMRDASRAMDVPAARGQYVHLYLDGLYWGVYNLTERPDEVFAASYLGGDESDYDSISDGELHSGSLTAWDALMQSSQAGLATAAAYQRVQGNNADGTRNTNYPVLIHLTNLVDIMILHIFSGAVDWPHHNWWAARRQGLSSGGYQFFVWDQEISNSSLTRQRTTTTFNNNPIYTEVASPNSPAAVYAAMRSNPEFRVFFGDRVQRHLFNDGVLSTAACVARWNALSAELDRALVGESARWGDVRRPTMPYKREVEWVSNNNWVVSTYFPSNAVIALKRFRDANLYPVTGAPRFSQHGGNVPNGYPLDLTHTNASGSIYFTVDGSDPRLTGGALVATASVYSQPIALNSPTLVSARVRSGTNWSALVQAPFTTPQDFGSLVVTEIHYNPPMLNNVDGEEFEFLELQNIGPNPLDLGSLSFLSGISFIFTNETILAPAAYFVLVRNPAMFSIRFPGAPWDGVYAGKLDNAGESLTLATPAGLVLDLSYDDLWPWPSDADGSGASLQRANSAADPNAAKNWTAASPTPGRALPPEFVDSDADGMTDSWETAHGFDPWDGSDAEEDPDQDGEPNVAEFRAGTNPFDGDDYLKIDAIEWLGSPSPGVVLHFRAAANRSYSILRRNLPDKGCWNKVADILPQHQAREVRWTNSVPAGWPTAVYRLVTTSAPSVLCPE